MDTHFPKILLHFANQRHPQWPTVLNSLDLFTDSFPLDSDKKVSFADLKATIYSFAKQMFGTDHAETGIKVVPYYFFASQ